MWPVITSVKVQKADILEKYRKGVDGGGCWRARHPALFAHDAAFVQTASHKLVLERIMRFLPGFGAPSPSRGGGEIVEAFRHQTVNNAKAGHAPPSWIVQQSAVMLHHVCKNLQENFHFRLLS